MTRGRKKGGTPVNARRHTSKPEIVLTLPDVPPSKETGLQTPLRANAGVFRPMNDENGRCDVKILRRGLNV